MSPRALRVALAAGLLVACDDPAPAPDGGPELDAGACGSRVVVLPDEPTMTAIDVRIRCAVSIELGSPRVLEVWVDEGRVDIDGLGEGFYLGPRVVDAGSYRADPSHTTRLHVRSLGAPPRPSLEIARSLTWTDATLLDDPEVAGWDRVMRAIVSGAHPGPLVDAFFRRFGTTAHSERLGPQRLLEDQITSQGSEPLAWDLDAFPFRATGVHNRIDLGDGTHCGELRVSFASTHPLHQPFHMIVLFRQPAQPEDRGRDSTAHCASTALRWARLSALDEADFHAKARAILDEALVHERFVALETVEFIISPWEWRQWFLEEGTLENRPLFQTVDTERLNRPGPDRDAFLSWVEGNAPLIDARRMAVPYGFASPSARVNDGVPWIPLDLTGVPALAERPRLRQQLEIVGCPACHTADADFVQTLPDRTFSPFYQRELVAREEHLRALAEGRAERPPFGPLQRDPVLPP